MTSFLLFVVAFVGGALNAVAGGGSFLTLPTLLYAGVAPVSANATSTFAMWPASLASALAYRGEIARARRWMFRLGAISLLGGLLGGLLLVRTSDESFVRLLPWLMLVAATTFSFGARLTAWARARRPVRAAPAAPPAYAEVSTPTAAEPGVRGERAGSPRVGLGESRGPDGHAGSIHNVHVPVWTLPLQLVIAIYGGYFGGGMGIMMLAAMAVAGMTDMHEMNGLKTALAIAINGVALAAFIASGSISWAPGIVMAVGGISGGYAGASVARRVPGAAVRRIVIVVAWTMTAYFFLR
ncbi:MAG TPA: sulfite exporter TauE/SafE family protein [Vicinamibacterales bacterium]|nr:sulfite exporter TauE/SafE family protein [Vicinamibacterales bacterium]